jgi:hypothetical protein
MAKREPIPLSSLCDRARACSVPKSKREIGRGAPQKYESSAIALVSCTRRTPKHALYSTAAYLLRDMKVRDPCDASVAEQMNTGPSESAIKKARGPICEVRQPREKKQH